MKKLMIALMGVAVLAGCAKQDGNTLKSGRVEFVIADIDPAKNCVKGETELALSDFITSEEYAVAIRKGQPELLKAINDTITELKANGKLAKWIADFTAEADRLKDK